MFPASVSPSAARGDFPLPRAGCVPVPGFPTEHYAPAISAGRKLLKLLFGITYLIRDFLQANDITILFFYHSIIHHSHIFFPSLRCLFYFVSTSRRTRHFVRWSMSIPRSETETLRSAHGESDGASPYTQGASVGTDKLPLTSKPPLLSLACTHSLVCRTCLCISPALESQERRMLCSACVFSLPR